MKSRPRTLVDVIESIKSNIDSETENLDDADYLEVMEEISSYATSCLEAKQEEMNGDDDNED
jgi:hypothetical protein